MVGGAYWKQLNLRIAFAVTDVILIFIFIATVLLNCISQVHVNVTDVIFIFTVKLPLSDLIFILQKKNVLGLNVTRLFQYKS